MSLLAEPSSQSYLEHQLQNAKARELQWKAVLPFKGLIDHEDETVNLFDYVGKEQQWRRDHAIRFDPLQFPPTPIGRKELMNHLRVIACYHGSKFHADPKTGLLRCYRCRISATTNKDDPNDYDPCGIAADIRRKGLHNDRRNNRDNGKKRKRATTTAKDTTGNLLCRLKLTFGIHKDNALPGGGYIFLKCTGNNMHQHHIQPQNGELSIPANLLTKEQCRIIYAQQHAFVGGTQAQKVLLELRHGFISASTHRRVIETAPDAITAKPGTGRSSASELLNWLRREASKPGDSKMSYCVLSYEIRPETLNLVSDFIRKPVGRPSKTNPPMAPIEVAKNLTYTDHSPIVGLSKTSKAKEACGQLFTIGNVNSTTEEGETDGLDSINQMSKEETKIPLKSVAPMEQLTTQSEIRLHLNSKCPWVNSNRSRVLIGASWMVEEDKRQFLRYPEVLFMDATHKTNNEGRPLLLICGQDSDGKAFVILRVFMPNETSAFYNWVFQEALPSMLGKEHLERVNLVLTDGDSNEFSALENSMLKLLPNALRGRCGHHLIKKTLQKKSIAPSYFKNRVLGEAILQEIEGWVRSWADGSSCLTEEEFMFSKNLLLDELWNNEQLQEVMGLESVGKLMDWVDTDVLPHEKNFAHYMKRDHQCLGEYVTNATEGLNYAAKHSSMSAKPDQKMVTSAGAMHSHDDMKNRERKKKKLRQFEDTPLFLERGNKRHNSDCFKELVPIGRSIMMDQVEQSAGNYVVAQISPDSFCVILDQSHVSRPHGCPAWFKGRPRFRSVNIVEVDKEDSNRVVLKCSCRHKQHYGLPCRHLLSIEHQYDLSDIACRWRNDYDLYAYSNGKEKTMTRLFAELSKVEHQGILVKSEFFGIRLMCIPHFIPVNKSGTGRLVDLGLLF